MGGRLPAHGLEKTRPPRIAPGRPVGYFACGRVQIMLNWPAWSSSWREA